MANLDQLPVSTDAEKSRDPIPEVRNFPKPEDQQLVDALLRDPLTSAARHLQEITGGRYRSIQSAATNAWKRLQKPKVQDYMRLQQERIRRAADLEQNDLLQMLAMVMRTDITQIAQWDDEGRVTFTEPDKLPTHARRAIKKLKTKTRYFENGGKETTTELELYSNIEALKLFAEIAGLKGPDGSTNINNYGVIYMNPPQTQDEALQGKTIYEG